MSRPTSAHPSRFARVRALSCALLITTIGCADDEGEPTPDDGTRTVAPDATTTCGNGVLDPGEACDPARAEGLDCAAVSPAFASGSATCTSACELDSRACVRHPGRCGDGQLDPGETCDDGGGESGDGCSRDCLVEAVMLPEPPASMMSGMGGAVYGSPTCAVPSTRRSYSQDRAPLVVTVVPRICRVGSPPQPVVTDAAVDAHLRVVNTALGGAGLSFVRGATSVVSDPLECEVNIMSSTHISRYASGSAVSVFYARNVFGAAFALGGFAMPQGVVMNASSPRLGDLLAHELGHVFGLDHPHSCYHGVERPERTPPGANCETAGDQLCSTPPDPGPLGVMSLDVCADGTTKNGQCTTAGCRTANCPGGDQPQLDNLMSYYGCGTALTAEQLDVVRCVARNEQAARALLSCSAGQAACGGTCQSIGGACAIGSGPCARPGVLACNGSAVVCQATNAPPGACASPVGGICDAMGSCVCPSGTVSCGGTCQQVGGACAVGQGSCARSGSVVCDGTTTRCSVAPQTSGQCGANPLRACNAAGACVEAWVDLCTDINYSGPGRDTCGPSTGCLRVPVRTGGLLQIPNLGSYCSYNDQVSSVRLHNVRRVTLYHDNTYRGRSITLTADCPDLHDRNGVTCGRYGGGGNIGDQATSVEVEL